MGIFSKQGHVLKNSDMFLEIRTYSQKQGHILRNMDSERKKDIILKKGKLLQKREAKTDLIKKDMVSLIMSDGQKTLVLLEVYQNTLTSLILQSAESVMPGPSRLCERENCVIISANLHSSVELVEVCDLRVLPKLEAFHGEIRTIQS